MPIAGAIRGRITGARRGVKFYEKNELARRSATASGSGGVAAGKRGAATLNWNFEAFKPDRDVTVSLNTYGADVNAPTGNGRNYPVHKAHTCVSNRRCLH